MAKVEASIKEREELKVLLRQAATRIEVLHATYPVWCPMCGCSGRHLDHREPIVNHKPDCLLARIKKAVEE